MQEQFQFTSGTIGYPFLFVLIIWVVYWIELRFHIPLSDYGIRPGEPIGLLGIAWSPVLHGSLSHLWNNTLPLLILSLGLFYFYRPIAWRVLLFGIILAGMGTWLIGRPSNHIGASGIVYFLTSFLFFKGILSKHFRLIALSLFVIFIYGSLVWGTLPIKYGVSWEGHASGLVAGIVAALIFRKKIARVPKYIWETPEYKVEEDDFMKQFDENGNFAPIVRQEEE